MTKVVVARITMIETGMMSSRMISARLKVIRVVGGEGSRCGHQLRSSHFFIQMRQRNLVGRGAKFQNPRRVTSQWENKIFSCGLVGDEHSSSVVRSHSS